VSKDWWQKWINRNNQISQVQNNTMISNPFIQDIIVVVYQQTHKWREICVICRVGNASIVDYGSSLKLGFSRGVHQNE
jgi:hypothetical protein